MHYKTADSIDKFLFNFSAVYAFDQKTVVRFGTGLFSDKFNALAGTGNRELQNGYSQATSTTITTDKLVSAGH